MTGRVRAYLAVSLDGFIAGPDHDLTWLQASYGDTPADSGVLRFDAFMAQVGALLMGRTTFDVVQAMNVWVYGETPVLVATHRPLVNARASVTTAEGSITDLVHRARELAKGRDVYLDGAALLRQALDAKLVDELVLTVVPTLLTRGTPLFTGLTERADLRFVSHRAFDQGLVQLTLEPRR